MLSIMFWKKRIYLDHAASTPATSDALRAYGAAATLIGNPSSPHAEGRAAKEVLEESRIRVGRMLSVKADDVIFTASATEANAIALLGHVVALKKLGRTRLHVLYLPSSHASVVATIETLKGHAVEAEALRVTDGEVDIQALSSQIRPETVLVTMDYVCGETGTIWNTREVAQTLRDARSIGEGRIMLHADASQAPRTELIERTRIGADMLTLDAQKIGGVRGAGVLIAPRTIPLSRIMEGGGQERALRPGTENAGAIAAFATALAEAQERYRVHREQWSLLREEVLERITHLIPGVLENRGKKAVPHILNISIPGIDTEYLAVLLDEAGFAVSTKSACESDTGEGSRAVALLFGSTERALSTLRISWGPETTKRDLLRFGDALLKGVTFLSNHE